MSVHSMGKSLINALCFLLCLYLFLKNAYTSYDSYMQGFTLTSTSIQPFENGMMDFPTIAVCDKFAYKNSSKVMLSFEDYRDNTFDPNDYLQLVEWVISIDGEKENLDEDTGRLAKVRGVFLQ